MDASYELYPDSSIVAFHCEGDEYNEAQSREYDHRGGYPVSRHRTAQAAIHRREELGAAWFGIKALSPVRTEDIEEIF